MGSRPVAVIVDIVRSRDLADRDEAQREIERVFRTVEATVPPVRPLWPTVGDEFQALFESVPDALQATAIARLLFPDEIDCRFGLGRGEVREVGEGPTGPIQDGSAWWSARDAIDEAHRRERSGTPYLRGWFVSDDPAVDIPSVVNAHLLLRDHAISEMKPRERRLTAGSLLGRSQAELAEEEGITQSAVSQSLRRSGGAALVAGQQVMRDGRAR